MLTSSSPTISAPASPSASFHSYHASRRTHSPRFAVSSASSRRFDSHAANPARSPIPTFAQSPPSTGKRKEYADNGTQYTPPDYPPTYRPPPPEPIRNGEVATAQPQRGESSTQRAATEPPEPHVRMDPAPVVSTEHVAPSGEASEESQGEGPRPQPRSRDSTSGPVVPAGEPSPAKRQRPFNGIMKAMPLPYETCDVKDLGVLISDMLMELVRINDAMPLRDGQLTRFHSRAPPAISVKDYLFRLIVHATLSPPILLSMVFYVDKLCAMYPAFTISSLTVHRFLITAATVAAKGLSDSFWTNSLYAKVGGVSLRELALLEVEFLKRLEWRIVPKPETLVDYYKGLVDRGEGYSLEGAPEDASPAMGVDTRETQDAQPQ